MPGFILDIWQQAEDDLNDIVIWYEDKKEGLGIEFLQRADEGIRMILRSIFRIFY